MQEIQGKDLQPGIWYKRIQSNTNDIFVQVRSTNNHEYILENSTNLKGEFHDINKGNSYSHDVRKYYLPTQEEYEQFPFMKPEPKEINNYSIF